MCSISNTVFLVSLVVTMYSEYSDIECTAEHFKYVKYIVQIAESIDIGNTTDTAAYINTRHTAGCRCYIYSNNPNTAVKTTDCMILQELTET